jgi:Na+/proline symporter
MNLGLPTVDYVVIAFYLVIMLGIGFYFSRFMTGAKEFFVGGNLIPGWVSGVSMYMTLFSAWTFTGAASFTYATGWYGVIYFATWPLAFFIGFQLSATRWRRTRITSPIEYVQTRFNRVTHLFLSIVMALSMIYWPAHHLASLSKICAPTLFPNSMLAIDLMIVITGIIILIYTFTGGLWAVCITDVVQSLILLSVCIVLIPTAFLSGDLGSIPEFVNKIPALKFEHVLHGTTVYNEWYLFGLVASNIFGNAVGDKAQRYYSVKDEKSAKQVGWVAFALMCTGPLLFGIPPLIGKVLWPEISMMQYFSGISKPEENIFIAVVLKYLPAGTIGIFISAMMAASMSAMDSVWNTVSSIISLDIYKNILKPKASDREILFVGRMTTIALAAIAILLALLITHSEYGIFTVSNIFVGLVAIPVSIPLFAGIIWRKISRWSAISSILAGTLVASTARFVLKYNLGPQFLLIVGVTLLFIFLSYPLGKLYLKNRRLALIANIALGSAFWCFFLLENQNPELALNRVSSLNLSQIGALAAALTLGALSHWFTIRYARDLSSSQESVDQFFEKLDRPIDVAREVLTAGKKETNILPLVGSISMLLSGLILCILLAPVARTKIGVNLAISGLLFIVGLGMFLSNKKIRG